MANLVLKASDGLKIPSEFVVTAHVTDLQPDEFVEYNFEIDDETYVTDIRTEENKFYFYLKYDKTINITCTVNIYKYESSDFTKTIKNTLTNTIELVSPQYERYNHGIEKDLDWETKWRLKKGVSDLNFLFSINNYGITEGINEISLNRIKNGLDYIRKNTGWNTFRIPEKIWDIVDKNDRDEIISVLETCFYTNRSGNNFTINGLNQDARFAMIYVFVLYIRWFVKTKTNIARDIIINNATLSNQIVSDFAFSNDSSTLTITNNIDNNINRVTIQDFDGDDIFLNFYDNSDYQVTIEFFPLTSGNETDNCEISLSSQEMSLCYGIDYAYETNKTYITKTIVGNDSNIIKYPYYEKDLSILENRTDQLLNPSTKTSVKIPEYVWDYIDQPTRDYILLYTRRFVYDTCDLTIFMESNIDIIEKYYDGTFSIGNNKTVEYNPDVFSFDVSPYWNRIEIQNNGYIPGLSNQCVYILHDIYFPETTSYLVFTRLETYSFETGTLNTAKVLINDDIIWESNESTRVYNYAINISQYADQTCDIKFIFEVYDDEYAKFYIEHPIELIVDSMSKDMFFTLQYFYALMTEWFYKVKEEDRLNISEINRDYFETDWGFSNVIETDSSSEHKEFSLDFHNDITSFNVKPTIYYMNNVNNDRISEVIIKFYDNSTLGTVELRKTPEGNASYYQVGMLTHMTYDFLSGGLTEKVFWSDYEINSDINYIKTKYLPVYTYVEIKPEHGTPEYMFNWSITSTNQYTLYDDTDRIFLILFDIGNYQIDCTVTDQNGMEKTYTENISVELDNKELTVPKDVSYSTFKGKFNFDIVVSADDKENIISDIILLNSQEQHNLFIYLRNKASNSNFSFNVSSIHDIDKNDSCIFNLIDFDDNNNIFFYFKTKSKYSINTSINRLYSIINLVLASYGYSVSVVPAYEYEPVYYSEEIVNKLKQHLDRMWRTKYYNINLNDAFIAMQKETDSYIDNLKEYSSSNFNSSLYGR